MRPWEFVNPADLELKAWPEKKEIIAGNTATFTIQIRNRTDKTVQIHYPTGQHWDYAVFHEGLQIYRWSQGLRWADSPHSIPLKRGEPMTFQMSWQSRDHKNRPLPQGVYKIYAMAMVSPRPLVTNTFSIRLLPEEIKKTEVIEVKLNSFFEIVVPRYSGKQEVEWQIAYEYNDNRIAVHELIKRDKELTIVFKAKRTGHVNFHLYGRHDTRLFSESLERRSYRIEVK
ncbi:MAG: BsuPI-related putative proteinase inhibitor [Candidatus Rifleibacteriota bacterium]